MAKVFKTLKKKAQATPLSGVILNSLKSDNPTQNAPSIQAVIDNMTPPMNKLKNGDFQINQRGQTTYNGNYSKYTYTVDVWRTATTASTVTSVVEVLDEGVEFSSNGTGSANLEQAITFPPSNVGYTAILMCENLVGSGIFGADLKEDTGWIETNINNGLNVIYIPPRKSIYRIIARLTDTSSVNLKYIDLYEGDIAYHHVKEDKDIALMRCQLYYRQFTNNFNLEIGYQSKTRDSVVLRIPLTLEKVPTVDLGNSWKIINIDTGSTNDKDDFNFTFDYKQGYLSIAFLLKSATTFSGNNYILQNLSGIKISCE